MPELPPRVDLDQLRRQAKDLLRAARNGDADAVAKIRAVSDRVQLAAAQAAVARAYGFAGWTGLKTEVERRQVLGAGDLGRLEELLARRPELAVEGLRHWCDHRGGPAPLSFVAMLRYDTATGEWRDAPAAAAVARRLLEAGAAVDGEPGDRETPLMTAASYGDAEVARVLIEYGADLDATAADDAGGVPGGTALAHAAVFGMTAVVDVLVAAGARVHGLAEAAAAGDITGRLRPDTPLRDRVAALVMAADHGRLDVIDQLLDAGTPVDATDAWGRRPLRQAEERGNRAVVEHLLRRGPLTPPQPP